MGFDQIKVSVKAFDVPTTIAAYREIARQTPYALHIGITEAGTARSGSIRNAVGIGLLLAEGIGDTIRVSMSADPKEEIPVAYDILRALNLRQRGPTIVAHVLSHGITYQRNKKHRQSETNATRLRDRRRVDSRWVVSKWTR
jgi:(E)-4-hydroxy-3-methylbut-2-enyl-diphosphate synthase